MKIGRYFILLILVIPVLILRDFTPNNELKYLSIVDEALRDGHFFTFYHQGELYADKPPLYFWLLMLSKWIWGEYNMFGLSLFSIIPALISVYIMNTWVEEKTTTSLRWNGSLMLFTSAFFIGSGLVLRMDIARQRHYAVLQVGRAVDNGRVGLVIIRTVYVRVQGYAVPGGDGNVIQNFNVY